MARIFAGNWHRVEPHILEAVQDLDDDYWVLLEFPVSGRDVDCLIVHPNFEPDRTATIILTELKSINDPIWGGWNGPWIVDRGGQQETLLMSNPNDVNPIQQAINASNGLNNWLANNYTSYKAFGNNLINGQRTKCYPFLLITTRDPNVQHTIDRPLGAYGSIAYNVDSWLQKVRNWSTDKSFPLDHDEIAKIVALLPVTPMAASDASPSPDDLAAIPFPDAGMPRAPADTRDDATARPVDELAWLNGFQQWADRLEARVASLEAQLAVASAGAATPRPVARDLTQEEVMAMTSAVTDIARVGGRRDFPTVIKSINHYLGYELSETRYNGFEKARFFFDQAVRQNLIRYGPLAGPAPTVYLSHERSPADRFAPPAVVR